MLCSIQTLRERKQKKEYTLRCLVADKELDEGICSLCIQRKSSPQRLKFRAFVKESLLQTLTPSMKVLLDCVQSHLHDFTLLRAQVLLSLFRHVL